MDSAKTSQCSTNAPDRCAALTFLYLAKSIISSLPIGKRWAALRFLHLRILQRSISFLSCNGELARPLAALSGVSSLDLGRPSRMAHFFWVEPAPVPPRGPYRWRLLGSAAALEQGWRRSEQLLGELYKILFESHEALCLCERFFIHVKATINLQLDRVDVA